MDTKRPAAPSFSGLLKIAVACILSCSTDHGWSVVHIDN